MNLDDVRRLLPVEDPAAYDVAYAEATVVSALGEAVHRAHEAAGLSEHDLATLMDVDEAEIERVEEGDPALSIGFLVRLARAMGVSVCLTLGGDVVDFDVALGDAGAELSTGA